MAINRDQLRCAVGSLYGEEFGADRYLRRFADLHVGLPVPAQPDTTTFLDGLLDATGLTARFGPTNGWIRQMMHLVVEHPECSLRDLEQATHLAAVVLSSLPDNDLWVGSAVALVVLRILDKDAYERFVRHETGIFGAAADINTALPDLRRVTGGTPRTKLRSVRCRLEALLLRMVSSDEEHIDQLDTTTFEKRYETATGCDGEHASEVKAHVDSLRNKFFGESVEIERPAALIDLVVYTP